MTPVLAFCGHLQPLQHEVVDGGGQAVLVYRRRNVVGEGLELATTSRHIALGCLGWVLVARLDSLNEGVLAQLLCVAIQADFPGYWQSTSPRQPQCRVSYCVQCLLDSLILWVRVGH